MRPHKIELEKDETSLPSAYEIKLVNTVSDDTTITSLHIRFQSVSSNKVVLETGPSRGIEMAARWGGILDDITVDYDTENTPRLILKDQGQPVVTEIFQASDQGGLKAKNAFMQAVRTWLVKQGQEPVRLPRSERPALQDAQTRLTA